MSQNEKMITRKSLVNTVLAIVIAIGAFFFFANLSQAANKCACENCINKRKSDGYYCEMHECNFAKCTSMKLEKGSYCKAHTCDGGTKGCYKRVSDNMHRQCTSCQQASEKKKKTSYTSTKTKTNSTNTVTTKTTNKTTTSNSKTSTGKKYSSSSNKKNRVEWPDCDDYDSYEDFMDDWDGDMPYGIDAEDYWDNW